MQWTKSYPKQNLYLMIFILCLGNRLRPMWLTRRARIQDEGSSAPGRRPPVWTPRWSPWPVDLETNRTSWPQLRKYVFLRSLFAVTSFYIILYLLGTWRKICAFASKCSMTVYKHWLSLLTWYLHYELIKLFPRRKDWEGRIQEQEGGPQHPQARQERLHHPKEHAAAGVRFRWRGARSVTGA